MSVSLRKRSAQRNEFLAFLLITAIEHAGYGFPAVIEYEYNENAPEATFAVIGNRYESDNEKYTVTLDTMAKGLGIIRNAIPATDESGNETHYVNAETFERLYFGGEARTELLLADRTNSDDGDYDVIGALAVLECALFGSVVYA